MSKARLKATAPWRELRLPTSGFGRSALNLVLEDGPMIFYLEKTARPAVAFLDNMSENLSRGIEKFDE